MTEKNHSPALSSSNFEEQIQAVEQLIASLSQGELSLDQVVEKVESGYQTIEGLKQRLDETKMKIESLREQFSGEEN